LPAKLDRVLSIAENGLIEGTLPERSAPSLDEAQSLADRAQSIAEYLSPASTEEIAQHVVRLFSGLGRRTESQDDEGERLLIYFEVLADMPAWAVSRACQDFLYGKRGDRKWLPSAAEIRAACGDLVAPWMAEKQRIEKILAAEIVNSNEYGHRARNLAHMRDTIAMLRGAEPEKHGDGMTAQQRAEKWLEEQAHKPAPAPIVGEGLRKYLAAIVSRETIGGRE